MSVVKKVILPFLVALFLALTLFTPKNASAEVTTCSVPAAGKVGYSSNVCYEQQNKTQACGIAQTQAEKSCETINPGKHCVATSCFPGSGDPSTCKQNPSNPKNYLMLQSFASPYTTWSCGGDQECGKTAGSCVSPACTPTTCAAKGYQCGQLSDGCGKTLNCGVGGKCSNSSFTCNTSTHKCAPASCTSLGGTCRGGYTCGSGENRISGACSSGICCKPKPAATCASVGGTCRGGYACGSSENRVTGTCSSGICCKPKPATCDRKIEISLIPDTKTGSPGDTLTYKVTIKNADSENCPASEDYTLSASINANTSTPVWSAPTIDKKDFNNLGRGKPGSANISVKSPKKASGTKKINVKVTRKDADNPGEVITHLNYVVKTTTPRPTTRPTVKPTTKPTVRPTTRPSASPKPSGPKPSISPRESPSPTPSPSVSPTGTNVSFKIGADGIGTTARIPIGGNKNPNHTTRSLQVLLYRASNNTQALDTTQDFTYNPASEKFEGNINIPSGFQTDVYNIYVGGPRFLLARYPGSFTITENQTNTLPVIDLVTGDINQTEESANNINLQDYVVLISCSIFGADKGPCDENANYKEWADLDDNGAIDQEDYTLWLSEKANQEGAVVPGGTVDEPSPTPTQIPSPSPTIIADICPPFCPPTQTPSPTLTRAPTPSPKVTVKPTVKPTVSPKVTAKPTIKPTVKPTAKPTVKPTIRPTVKPTAKPTAPPKPFNTKHIMGAFTVGRVQDVGLAYSLGLTSSIYYGSAPNQNSPVTQEMDNRNMKQFDGRIANLIYRFECARLKKSNPDVFKSWPTCSGRKDADLINSETQLLSMAEDYFRNSQNNNAIGGYYAIDDWHSKAGSVKEILKKINRLANRYTPGKPMICGFTSGHLAAGGGDGWDNASAKGALKNYSPEGCDLVAVYVYAQHYAQPGKSPKISEYDWTMKKLLPKIKADLTKVGWTNAKSPLVGIPQSSGGESPNNYIIIPTYSSIRTETRSFCEQGAQGIMYYTWNSSAYGNRHYPHNDSQIAKGIKDGIADCKSIWKI